MWTPQKVDLPNVVLFAVKVNGDPLMQEVFNILLQILRNDRLAIETILLTFDINTKPPTAKEMLNYDHNQANISRKYALATMRNCVDIDANRDILKELFDDEYIVEKIIEMVPTNEEIRKAKKYIRGFKMIY